MANANPPTQKSPAPPQPLGKRAIAAAGAVTAKVAGWFQSSKEETVDFEGLYWRESHQLGDLDDDWKLDVQGVNHDEPWVAFTPKDRFGVALSGGGIRSATFNLGLLQSFADLGILPHVDYLSTVSGGGYVGGFWTAWLSRKPGSSNPPDLRVSPFDRPASGEEAPEVRHLREFSRFLLPRIGLMETELWGIVTTLLGGLLPALLTAVAFLGLCWSAWLLIVSSFHWDPLWSVTFFLALLISYMVLTEWRWRIAKKSELDPKDQFAYWAGALAIIAACEVAWFAMYAFMAARDQSWTAAFGSPPNLRELPVWLRPVIVLAAVSLAALVARIIATRILRTEAKRPIILGFERAVSRILALLTAMTVAAALWFVAQWIVTIPFKEGLGPVGLSTGGFAALFAWLHNWFSRPIVETRASTLLTKVLRWLRKATPRLLAWIVLVGMLVLVGAGLHWLTERAGDNAWSIFGCWAVACGGILALTSYFFDPARVGLHDFYRTRISRCYLGASNRKPDEGPEANRYVVERPDDDLLLASVKHRPVHLICVAANDMSGDRLGSLYRGARSAVLSGNGITLGNKTARLDELRLSSALTASAAAFNSEMGRVSMDLGLAVTFLMSALNLRLGLWVPHPKNKYRGDYTFPGRFFLLELLGRSNTTSDNLHLSDGNHFENFGLYELVRRHCRHIVVSDCGADPSVVFDDLANVVRRIREDFGVEIEIDVAPLRPGPDGNARQHAVVGTIHYDGPAGLDKGSLIYFKPVLTGDEPSDVLQYKSRNSEFPQQTTQDQFYDEPQWESYRRLGEHAGRSILGFLEKRGSEATEFTDRMFFRARELWQLGPDDQKQRFLEMSARCSELEASILTSGSPYLSEEFFSETTLLVPALAASVRASDRAHEIKTVSSLMRVLQLMEDAWLANDIDRYWSHPLNQGWLAYFQRWAATPSLRRWWPVLAPIYGSGFRSFVEERLGLGLTSESTDDAHGRVHSRALLTFDGESDTKAFESTHLWRHFRRSQPNVSLTGKKLFRFDLRLLARSGELDTMSLPVGLALVSESTGDAHCAATWNAAEMFVPPWLHGAGITGRFLDATIDWYKHAGIGTGPTTKYFKSLWVEFKSQKRPGTEGTFSVLGPAARLQRVREIEFYKSRGFEYRWEEERAKQDLTLVLDLR